VNGCCCVRAQTRYNRYFEPRAPFSQYYTAPRGVKARAGPGTADGGF